MTTEIQTYKEDYYYYERVIKNIKKYRKLKKLTQQELADKSGLTMHYIATIESKCGKKHFSLTTVGKIAEALEIDIHELFEQ